MAESDEHPEKHLSPKPDKQESDSNATVDRDRHPEKQ
jgi:hypothetical protein